MAARKPMPAISGDDLPSFLLVLAHGVGPIPKQLRRLERMLAVARDVQDAFASDLNVYPIRAAQDGFTPRQLDDATARRVALAREATALLEAKTLSLRKEAFARATNA